jgi:hypothetical protein
MRYSLVGFDIITERITKRINIPDNKVPEIKQFLDLGEGPIYYDFEIETYKAQEILDRLQVCMRVNEYDWFFEEKIDILEAETIINPVE